MSKAKLILHGVFLEVFAVGVLITGEPGTGKSELALELISRGHRLVADDAPEFSRTAANVVEGRCPPAIQDSLEVRGLGILNMRAMFGDDVVQSAMPLRLILHLHVPEPGAIGNGDRLAGPESTQQVLDVNIPRLDLPVLPGRNLAVLAEAAVRNFKLKDSGFDAAAEFVERHAGFLEKNDNTR